MLPRTWIGLSLTLAALTTSEARAQVGWVGGPWELQSSAARNPDVAERLGQVHIVYRLHGGGIGHITGNGSGNPTAEYVIEGSVGTAATMRAWNLPVVAVDDTGAGHVAWGPMSTDGLKGAWYARIGPDGALADSRKLTDLWSEDLDVVVARGGVHVLSNAIGATQGVYDFWGPIAGGPTNQTQAWQFGNFSELAASPAPWGLAMIGRFGAVKRIDQHVDATGLTGNWQDFANHLEPPAPITSIGRPTIAFDGDLELWAAIGWIDAAPSTIVVSKSGDQGWQTLSTGPLFDPDDQDGSVPRVALAVNATGQWATAWLSASAPRLRIAIGQGAWGTPVTLPSTESANTFALCAEGDVFRVVYTNEDGTLHTGKVGQVEPVDAGADAIADAAPDAPIDVMQEAAADVIEDVASDAVAQDAARQTLAPAADDGSSCACSAAGKRGVGSSWLAIGLIAAVGIRRKRRREGSLHAAVRA